MTDFIAKFEQECESAAVKPTAALKAGGVHPAQWRRWKTDKFMPSMRSFQKAQEGLAKLRAKATA